RCVTDRVSRGAGGPGRAQRGGKVHPGRHLVGGAAPHLGPGPHRGVPGPRTRRTPTLRRPDGGGQPAPGCMALPRTRPHTRLRGSARPARSAPQTCGVSFGRTTTNGCRGAGTDGPTRRDRRGRTVLGVGP